MQNHHIKSDWSNFDKCIISMDEEELEDITEFTKTVRKLGYALKPIGKK